ncbi:MAG: twitching motility protein PilT [Acidimicrobiales bacterium]
MTKAREGLVYGVGALRAAARGDRMVWAVHRAALANGLVPVVPAAAVAEAFRTEARGDRLGDLLDGAVVEPMDDGEARRAGELAARADTTDLVAVATAVAAARRNCAVVASRQNALRSASGLLGHELVLYAV